MGSMDEPFFTPPGEGERIGSRGYRVLAELPDIEALDLSFGPDFEGVDPHTHADHTDSFYVLEGTFAFTCGNREFGAREGAFVLVPRGTAHIMRAGPGGGALLAIFAPGGLEAMFLELGRLQADSLTDLAVRAEIARLDQKKNCALRIGKEQTGVTSRPSVTRKSCRSLAQAIGDQISFPNAYRR